MNRILIAVCLVVALSLFTNAYQYIGFLRLAKEHNATTHDYKQSTKRSEQTIKALRDSIDQSAMRVKGLLHYVERHEDSLKIERAAKNKWRNEYARLQNSHLSRSTSNPELDSLVTGFLTEH